MRLTDIPWHLGPCVMLAGSKLGDVDVFAQGCDCKITPGNLGGLFEIEPCAKHSAKLGSL